MADIIQMLWDTSLSRAAQDLCLSVCASPGELGPSTRACYTSNCSRTLEGIGAVKKWSPEFQGSWGSSFEYAG